MSAGGHFSRVFNRGDVAFATHGPTPTAAAPIAQHDSDTLPSAPLASALDLSGLRRRASTKFMPCACISFKKCSCASPLELHWEAKQGTGVVWGCTPDKLAFVRGLGPCMGIIVAFANGTFGCAHLDKAVLPPCVEAMLADASVDPTAIIFVVQGMYGPDAGIPSHPWHGLGPALVRHKLTDRVRSALYPVSFSGDALTVVYDSGVARLHRRMLRDATPVVPTGPMIKNARQRQAEAGCGE